MTTALRKRHIASVFASILILLLMSQNAVGAYVVSQQADPYSQYFPETKQNVNPPFIGYWQTHGGLAQQGYPISGELQLVSTDGKTYKTQFFERAVFEQHPEYAATPNEVLLKLVGQTFYDRRFKDGPPKDQATNPDNTLTFKETGHSIGGKFRAYWEKHGGLAQQGYPMTDEFKMVSTDGKEYTTQIFQRAVFELHPEFAGSENEVLLRLLGVEELEEANRPAATATPVVAEPTPSPEPSPTTIVKGVYDRPLANELPQFAGFEFNFGDYKLSNPGKFAKAIFKSANVQQNRDLMAELKNTSGTEIENFLTYKSVLVYLDEKRVEKCLVAPVPGTFNIGKRIIVEKNNDLVKGTTGYLYYGGARYSVGLVEGHLRIHFTGDWSFSSPYAFDLILMMILNNLAHLNDPGFKFPDTKEYPYFNFVFDKRRNGTSALNPEDVSGMVGR